jgi:hypothetical protein
VCVVESNKALTVRAMKGQRIIEAVRPGRARRYPPHHEPHQVPAIRVDHKHLAIQIEQGVKERVALHLLSLSRTDK